MFEALFRELSGQDWFASLAHLCYEEAVEKMGPSDRMLLSDERPHFPHFHSHPHGLHHSCALPLTPPAPTLKRCPIRDEKIHQFRALLRKSTAKMPIFRAFGHLSPINTGIRTANTICCALYLTHPTEGVTFTTATPTDNPVSLHFLSLLCRRRLPRPVHPRSPQQRRSRLQNWVQTHRTP